MTDGKSVCLGVESTLELVTRYYLLTWLSLREMAIWSENCDEACTNRVKIYTTNLVHEQQYNA
jgi:hypothetical protein